MNELSSKIVVTEEAPGMPSINTLATAVVLAVGTTERGPFGARLCTGWEDYVNLYGGFTADATLPLAVWGFFNNGGSFIWICRTVHYTDINDQSTATSDIGSRTIQNSGAAASAASVTGTAHAPFVLEDGMHIDIDTGAGTVVSTFHMTAASILSTGTYPMAPSGGESIGITIMGARGTTEQTVTLQSGDTTAALQAARFNAGLDGAKAIVNGGQLQLICDRKGSGSGIRVTTPGTANALLNFPTSQATGTGNVADSWNVTGLEVDAVVEAAVATAKVDVNQDTTLSFNSVATGSAASIRIMPTSTVTFGCDSVVHNGSNATPQVTLTVRGKTPGAYTDAIRIKISDASNGISEQFNLQVLVDGKVKETFTNLIMTANGAVTKETNWVQTKVNDTKKGSILITAEDMLLPFSSALKRPVNGTTAALVGGSAGLLNLADIDFLGSSEGKNGLHAFDAIQGGTLLIVPGITSPAVVNGMVDYCEINRNGTIFTVLDCPAGLTAVEMIDWWETTGLEEKSEFCAVYWPRVKIPNPSKTVFGNSDTLDVASAGYIVGKYSDNDNKPGGIYESPAGIDGWGVIRGIVGVENDPSGSEQHEVLDETKRDLIYPHRINPITKLPGTPWHIDGGRTAKSSGNFAHIGQRRGAIFIETSVKNGLQVLRHRFNNVSTRAKANRMISDFLFKEMGKGAFASTNPETAYTVDTSNKLNPLVVQKAGIFKARVGLAFNTPNEFTYLSFAQDTRKLEEELEG